MSAGPRVIGACARIERGGRLRDTDPPAAIIGEVPTARGLPSPLHWRTRRPRACATGTASSCRPTVWVFSRPAVRSAGPPSAPLTPTAVLRRPSRPRNGVWAKAMARSS